MTKPITEEERKRIWREAYDACLGTDAEKKAYAEKWVRIGRWPPMNMEAVVEAIGELPTGLLASCERVERTRRK